VKLATEQQTLRDVLTAQAHRYERKVFLEHGSSRFSYSDVDDRTDRVATGLSRIGIRPGDRVALLLSNSPELVFFLLGTPKVGMVPVPIDPDASEEEISSILWHCGATAIVTEKRFDFLKDRTPQIRHWIAVDGDSFAEPPFNKLEGGSVLGFWPDLDPDSAALISYAPGVAAGHKGVVLTHRNIVSNCLQVLQPFRIDETDRFLCGLPLSTTVAEILLLIVPWLSGAACVLRQPGAGGLLRDIQESRVTVLAGVPELLGRLASSREFADSDLSALRLAISFSGPIDRAVLRQFEEQHDALIVESYGALEASCLVCSNPYTGLRKPGALGLVLPGQECRVVDRAGKDLPAGAAGEILVRGPNVMKEYFRDPVATAKALKGGWLHTGDQAWVDSDGYYFPASGGGRP
jgi:long-chain acyl-CoA synthetase